MSWRGTLRDGTRPSRLLRRTQAAEGPEREPPTSPHEPERECHVLLVAGDEAPARLEHARQRVDVATAWIQPGSRASGT